MKNHIAGKGQNSTIPVAVQFGDGQKLIPMPVVLRGNENSRCAKAAVERDYQNGKSLRLSQRGSLRKSRSKKEVKKRGTEKLILCFIDGHLSSAECGVGAGHLWQRQFEEVLLELAMAKSRKLQDLKSEECHDVWIRLPRHKWPKWNNID